MSSSRVEISDLESLKRVALEETNRFAWPTFWLGIFTIFAIVSATTLAVAGVIPLWLGGVINFAGFYTGYTVGHEIIHQNLTGRHRGLGWLNVFFATLFFSVPFHSFTMHRFIHLRHHAYTNHPQKDPDAWINGRNFFELCFKLATHYPHYQYHAIVATRGAPNRLSFLLQSMTEQLVPIVIAAWLFFSGFALEVVLLWVAPAFLIYPSLAFILDWAPHHDLKDGATVGTTRMLGAPSGLAGKILNWLYLFQNYHLIHHLYPRVPFYRYAHIYNAGKEPLREEGAQIYSGFDHGKAAN